MILKVKNVSKSFKDTNTNIEVLKDVSFEVTRGEKVAILGRSGSGKSTLLSLLSGLDSFDGGEIEFDQHKFSNLSELDFTHLRNKEIGIVFQQFHLIPHLTALENVHLPLEISGKDDRDFAMRLLESVGLGDRMDHLPAQLSGGEKQRVAVARSLIQSPKLLLADEPSGSLDNSTGQEVMDLVFRLAQEHKTTLLLVTHDEALASRCERTLTLTKGSMVSS